MTENESLLRLVNEDLREHRAHVQGLYGRAFAVGSGLILLLGGLAVWTFGERLDDAILNAAVSGALDQKAKIIAESVSNQITNQAVESARQKVSETIDSEINVKVTETLLQGRIEAIGDDYIEQEIQPAIETFFTKLVEAQPMSDEMVLGGIGDKLEVFRIPAGSAVRMEAYTSENNYIQPWVIYFWKAYDNQDAQMYTVRYHQTHLHSHSVEWSIDATGTVQVAKTIYDTSRLFRVTRIEVLRGGYEWLLGVQENQ